MYLQLACIDINATVEHRVSCVLYHKEQTKTTKGHRIHISNTTPQHAKATFVGNIVDLYVPADVAAPVSLTVDFPLANRRALVGPLVGENELHPILDNWRDRMSKIVPYAAVLLYWRRDLGFFLFHLQILHVKSRCSLPTSQTKRRRPPCEFQ